MLEILMYPLCVIYGMAVMYLSFDGDTKKKGWVLDEKRSREFSD